MNSHTQNDEADSTQDSAQEENIIEAATIYDDTEPENPFFAELNKLDTVDLNRYNHNEWANSVLPASTKRIVLTPITIQEILQAQINSSTILLEVLSDFSVELIVDNAAVTKNPPYDYMSKDSKGVEQIFVKVKRGTSVISFVPSSVSVKHTNTVKGLTVADHLWSVSGIGTVHTGTLESFLHAQATSYENEKNTLEAVSLIKLNSINTTRINWDSVSIETK